MNRLFLGGALGALAMYFLDPQLGRRRRARTRDKALHAGRVLNEAGKVTARDTAHRARGVWAGARRLFRREAVGDEVLTERVRAELGRFVSHAHAVQVSSEGGYVTLSGPILAVEVRPLLRHVRRVPGVRAVSDRLTVHEDASHVSALQGGQPAPGSRFELMQENWSPAARLAAGSLGAGMVGSAFRIRGTGFCALLGVSGGALLARAATNMSLSRLFGFSGGITVQKVINVDAPVSEVFEFWTDHRNLLPAGVPVQWNAQLVERVPGSLLRWRSTDDSAVKHEGWVRFEENGHGGSRITVRLSYVPPGGAFGHAVAALFGADPKSGMDSDLLRMKTLIETGRVPHDAARPAGQAS